MKAELINTGDLTSQLTITLEKDDYLVKYDTELKKLKNKAQLKGFRKGKVPITALKKMYGKGVLVDVINDELQNRLSTYLTDNSIDILGNPLPSENQKTLDFDLNSLGEYEFIFDLGLAPSFEIEGISTEDVYQDYKVEVTDELIDEELESLQKRMGSSEEIDAPIELKDILEIEITEVEPAEGRDAYTTTITVMTDTLTEDMQSRIIGKRLGDDLPIDLLNLEKNTTEDYVKKYFLKDAPEGVTYSYKGTIAAIKRLKEAELDQELFDKAFGEGEVSTIQEARDFLRKELETFYAQQGQSITKRYILETILDKNTFALPQEFLKRWLLSSNEKVTKEEVERDFEGFEKNLRWTLIKQKIAENYDIKIEAEDLRSFIKDKIIRQFGQYGYPGLNFDDMTNRVMQNQQTVQKEYEELLAERVMDEIYQKVSLEEKKLSLQEYKETVKSLQENIA